MSETAHHVAPTERAREPAPTKLPRKPAPTKLPRDAAPIELTRDAWNRLLRALDPDAAQAASRYERLRQRLIALYRLRGLPCPEDLADEALDRLAYRLMRGALAAAEVAPHLHEVARRIADEADRRSRRERALDPTALPQPPAWLDDDPLARLCRCLDELPRSECRTLLEYETGFGHDRVRRRKALAAELGIPMNALRVRVHRLRARLIAMMHDDDGALRPRRDARPGRSRPDNDERSAPVPSSSSPA